MECVVVVLVVGWCKDEREDAAKGGYEEPFVQSVCSMSVLF